MLSDSEDTVSERGSRLGLLVLAVLGAAFIAIGLFAGIGQVARTLREARLIENLPELDASAVRGLAPDTPVAVTGILELNAARADAAGQIIYLEQIWAIADNEDDGWEGSWETVYRAMPTSTLTLGGGSVILRYTGEIAIDRPLHEDRPYIPQQGRKVEGIVEGTLRHIGFKAGDQITVVGTTTATGILPSRVFGGDRQALQQHFEQQVLGLRIAGAIFGLVGLLLIAVAGVWLWRQRTAN